jgi:signal transduction histidine kinase
VARDGIDIMRLPASERGILLSGDLKPASCKADSERILQIVLNLFTNAIKFCPAGAKVHVATSSEGGKAMMRVSDTGPGIAPHHLPHLFERFYRVDQSRTRSTGGVGLGLAICESIVRAHGGTISVESELGKGSTFTLHL